MKNGQKVWQIEYQIKKLFGTEAEARRFYKKALEKEALVSISIKHRVKDNAERIGNRIMEKIYAHLDLGKTLRKLTITEQKRVKRVFMKIASEILETLK